MTRDELGTRLANVAQEIQDLIDQAAPAKWADAGEDARIVYRRAWELREHLAYARDHITNAGRCLVAAAKVVKMPDANPALLEETTCAPTT